MKPPADAVPADRTRYGSMLVALGAAGLLAGQPVGAAAETMQPECLTAGSAVVCTYLPGSLKTFTVPDGITSVDLTAIGARGQGTTARYPAVVSGRVAVAAGDQLSIRVPATSAGPNGIWPDAPVGQGNSGGGSANVMSPTVGKIYAIAGGSGGAGGPV
ncbi:hypothetical protein, partial [Skermania piniformis]